MRRAFFLSATFLVLTLAACRRPAEEPPRSSDAPASAVRVTDIKIGRGLDGTKQVMEETHSLAPADTVYVSVITKGSAPRATLTARWTYGDGQVVDESTQTITPTGRTTTEFHVSKPDGWPAGDYRVEIALDGVSAGSKDFEVKS